MPHGLRAFALLVAVGAVGCTAPEKIAPQRLQLPPPQLPPSSPTATSKPTNPPIDNRGQPRPIATSAPALSDNPMPGQGPAILPPPATTNPATMPLSPGDAKVPGRGAPAIPTPSPAPVGVNPIYTPPELGTPPATGPTPPSLGKPIEVVPPLPPAK